MELRKNKETEPLSFLTKHDQILKPGHPCQGHGERDLPKVCGHLEKRGKGQGLPEAPSESLSPLFLILLIHTMEVLFPTSRRF